MSESLTFQNVYGKLDIELKYHKVAVLKHEE